MSSSASTFAMRGCRSTLWSASLVLRYSTTRAKALRWGACPCSVERLSCICVEKVSTDDFDYVPNDLTVELLMSRAKDASILSVLDRVSRDPTVGELGQCLGDGCCNCRLKMPRPMISSRRLSLKPLTSRPGPSRAKLSRQHTQSHPKTRSGVTRGALWLVAQHPGHNQRPHPS